MSQDPSDVAPLNTSARTPDQLGRAAILSAEAELTAGVLQKDRTRAAAVLAPDFVAIGHAGNVVGRDDYLDIHFSPDRDFVQFETRDQKVLHLGGAAVVYGWTTARNANSDDQVPPKQYLAVVVPVGGRWIIQTWQETPIRDESF